jgi:hypothetical protein
MATCRPCSPEFSAIRQTGAQQARIHTAAIWQQLRPQFRPAHFTCKKNLNNIDLLLQLEYDFVAAVGLLERWLKEHESRQGKSK